MVSVADLLIRVRDNLILDHREDGNLLRGYIRAAVDYAERYQNKEPGYYFTGGIKMPPSTEQAVIMLASHHYESRDGSTGGFFADKADAAAQVMKAVDRLLSMAKDWRV